MSSKEQAKLQLSAIAEQVFNRTFEHPWAKQGLVEMIPTLWVAEMANPSASDMTDLAPEKNQGEIVTLSELWQNIRTEGMRDPFILSAGYRDGLSRLEAGSHRIRVFHDNGIPFVPATVLLGERANIYPSHGEHVFERNLRIPLHANDNEPETYPFDHRYHAKPSDIFEDIHRMKEAGELPAPGHFL